MSSPDTDGDGIADIHEPNSEGVSSDPNNNDTYNYGAYGAYGAYEDNEVRCLLKELNHSVVTYSNLDWSKPGKQY